MYILKFYQTVKYLQCYPKLISLESPFLEVNEPQNEWGIKKTNCFKKTSLFKKKLSHMKKFVQK